MSKFIAGELPLEERTAALDPVSDDSSELLVAVRPADYCASALAKAVEDCDVQLLGLSVTSMRTPEGNPVVAMRVGASTTGGIERSLGRYGYEVIHSLPTDKSRTHAQARERVNELLHMLEI